MVAAHRATVATREGEVMYNNASIQQSIFCGSKTSFRISPQSPAVSTHHWNCLKFNLNAKQQNKRYLCLPVTVLLPQQSHSSGPYTQTPICSCAQLHRSPWPFYCLWLAVWYIWFVPNQDGLPFCSCHFFSAAYFSSCCLLWLNCSTPKEIWAFSCYLLFCFKWFRCNFQPSERSAL